MRYVELTETGIEFIRNIANKAPKKSLLEGNNGALPYSDKKNNQNIIWKANINNGNKLISTNIELGEYLIVLFNKYAKEFGMDANIIAAQAYQESRYKAWTYNNNISTASGIPQIVMRTMYDVIYRFNWLTSEEKEKIIVGLEEPESRSSWRRVEKEKFLSQEDYNKQERNRTILHQNIIDNLDVLIKIQCSLMNYIANRNNNLASSTLFAYNRGSELDSTNYIQLINSTSNNKGNAYCDEGIKYVEHIFGYLGDKNNKYVNNLDSVTKGFWFGYKLDFTFDEFNADKNSNYVQSRSTKNIGALSKELRDGYNYAKNKFINAHSGFTVVLNSVYRTPEYQNELYQIGRNSRGEIIGKTLTPLDGFNNKSKHNYYKTLAFDYNIFDANNQYLDGKNMLIYRPFYEEFYEYLLEVVPNAVWGGNFKNQPNDVVHIQI